MTASEIEPFGDYRRITLWNKFTARITTPLVRAHIESLWKQLDSARFHLSWYTNGNAEMQREHYRHEVDKQKQEIVEHKEHISRLRDLLWSAEQELRELKSR
jgi:hypothetical protein